MLETMHMKLVIKVIFQFLQTVTFIAVFQHQAHIPQYMFR